MDHNKLWKIFKEMGIPDHLLVSWETWIQIKKQQLEPYMEQQTGSKLGKEYSKAIYWHYIIILACIFNFYAEGITWHSKLDESQGGIKIIKRNINNLRYADGI